MGVETQTSLSFSSRIANTMVSGALYCIETAAQYSIGQTILTLADRFLWIVEKSSQWSLPSPEEGAAEENGKSFGKFELVRPLPWIFFLPTLIMLRFLRMGLNIGAFVLGYPQIEPCAMVKFLQKNRRRLRTIKSNGIKYLRHRKDSGKIKGRDSTMNDVTWSSIQLMRTIQQTLSSLSCLDGSKMSPSPPPTRIKIRMNHESTPTPDEKSTTESATSPTHIETKRKYSELSSDGQLSDDSEEETIEAKIDRLASLDDSLDDEDFNPSGLSNSEDDSSNTSSDGSSISETELENLQDEAKLIMHRAFAGVAEVIKEEPEPLKRPEIKEKTDESEISDNPSTVEAPKNFDEHQEYHSPCKLSDDGDTAFYSPISSNSSSPDRTVPVVEQGQQCWPGGNGIHTTNTCRNGEVNSDQSKQTGTSTDKRTNGHAEEKGSVSQNVSGRVNKPPHHRGRRAAHSSRKKK